MHVLEGGRVGKMAILEEGSVLKSEPPCLQGSLLLTENKNRKQLIARHGASLLFPNFLSF